MINYPRDRTAKLAIRFDLLATAEVPIHKGAIIILLSQSQSKEKPGINRKNTQHRK